MIMKRNKKTRVLPENQIAGVDINSIVNVTEGK
jgi:hypothetical protein